MGLNSLLEIGRRSLQNYSARMNTVSQNIANAETEGYSRRRVHLQSEARTSPGIFMPSAYGGVIGNGSSIASIERVHDALLSQASWQAESGVGSSQEERRLLGAVEGLLAPGTSSDLSEINSRFFDSWEQLASDPTSTAARQQVLDVAGQLTSRVNGLYDGLSTLEQETTQTLRDGLGETNQLLDRIAELNGQIREADAKGTPDLKAQDDRDKLMKELGSFLPLQVSEDGANGFTVTVQGKAVIQGDVANHLTLDTESADAPQVRFEGTSVSFEIGESGAADGRVGAWLRTIRQTIPEVRSEIRSYAENLATEINDIHDHATSGGSYALAPDGLGGGPGTAQAGALFTASTASDPSFTFELAVTDPAQLATSDTSGETGNSAVARKIADLRGGFDSQMTALNASVGRKLEQAASDEQARSAVAGNLEAMERGRTGVSLDEEMTKMIENQRAYQASARIIQTTQTMFDTLMRM